MPNAIEFACIVVDIVIPAEPSKFAVPTTSPDNAIALAVVKVSAEPVTFPVTLPVTFPVKFPVTLPVTLPSKLATKVPTE